MIPFNIPCSTNEEVNTIASAIASGQLAGNGNYSRLCEEEVKKKFGFEDVLFTPSCTNALEIAALLCNFSKGDEVIVPSFTHTGTVNAFARCGVVLKFCDCLPGQPHIDPGGISALIGPSTRAIVIVHYAGIACNMEAFVSIARKNNLLLIEDAAHAIGAKFNENWLGTLGDFAAFSFHETKNINCGQGGMLVVNNKKYAEHAREIRNQGTNRHQFEKGYVTGYSWTRPGGAFQLADLNAAFLYPQLQRLDAINLNRMRKWQLYYKSLDFTEGRRLFHLPAVPGYALHNAHIFYLILKTAENRNSLLQFLRQKNIHAVFHYIPLHSSAHAIATYGRICLPHADAVSKQIIRLPLYDGLTTAQINEICDAVAAWARLNSE